MGQELPIPLQQSQRKVLRGLSRTAQFLRKDEDPIVANPALASPEPTVSLHLQFEAASSPPIRKCHMAKDDWKMVRTPGSCTFNGRLTLETDPTTHHHTMQHRAVANLQSESGSAAGLGNYSRTPELRVSHKLAERKRRSEMKDLFDDLNKAVPNNGGTKASKWEILSKGILLP